MMIYFYITDVYTYIHTYICIYICVYVCVLNAAFKLNDRLSLTFIMFDVKQYFCGPRKYCN